MKNNRICIARSPTLNFCAKHYCKYLNFSPYILDYANWSINPMVGWKKTISEYWQITSVLQGLLLYFFRWTMWPKTPAFFSLRSCACPLKYKSHVVGWNKRLLSIENSICITRSSAYWFKQWPKMQPFFILFLSM